MWTAEYHRAADRSGLRYPSDLTDSESAVTEPMTPPTRHGVRRRSVKNVIAGNRSDSPTGTLNASR
jgi:hypothetical protein